MRKRIGLKVMMVLMVMMFVFGKPLSVTVFTQNGWYGGVASPSNILTGANGQS